MLQIKKLKLHIFLIIIVLGSMFLHQCISFGVDQFGFTEADYLAEAEVTSLQEKLIETKSGASIYIPENAVPPSSDGTAGALTFTIEKGTPTEIPTIGNDETASAVVYKFGPSEIVFAQPVEISMPVLEKPDEDADIVIYRINPETGEAEMYPAFYDSTNNKVSTFTQEFSFYFYAMRRMQAQQRMSYGDGAVLIRNSMPVPVKVSIISSKLKYPTFGNFNQQNATAYLFASGQTGTRNEVSWKLPQGSYTLCFEWSDGHYMNPGTKTYYSTRNINLTRPWTPNLNHEVTIDFYSNGETGNCGGKQWDFLPPKDDHKYGTLTDRRDNNTYKTIDIGKQTWMAENLKYLPAVSPASEGWYGEKYYYVYGYNGTNVKEAIKTENYKKYGVLYNWDAAMDGEEGSEENPSKVQGVCPKGWHLPSTQEWKELIEYLAMNKYAYQNSENSYQIAKALAATTHWEKNNTEEYGAIAYDLTKNNKSGFSALPAGYFFMNSFAGSFDQIGFVGRWWTSTNYNDSNEWAYNYYLNSTSKELYEYIDFMYLGFSVRCVKD